MALSAISAAKATPKVLLIVQPLPLLNSSAEKLRPFG
jgi:hypothetical protein